MDSDTLNTFLNSMVLFLAGFLLQDPPSFVNEEMVEDILYLRPILYIQSFCLLNSLLLFITHKYEILQFFRFDYYIALGLLMTCIRNSSSISPSQHHCAHVINLS